CPVDGPVEQAHRQMPANRVAVMPRAGPPLLIPDPSIGTLQDPAGGTCPPAWRCSDDGSALRIVLFRGAGEVAERIGGLARFRNLRFAFLRPVLGQIEVAVPVLVIDQSGQVAVLPVGTEGAGEVVRA